MFLIFCSKYDREIFWLRSQLQFHKDADTEFLFVEDLYDCKNWEVRQSEHEYSASVILPNGRQVTNKKVSLFLNRVDFLHHAYWDKLQDFEHRYFVRQWNACMFQWLKAFDNVLINKPLPGKLGGFTASAITWQVMAVKAGFDIKEQYISSDYCDPSKYVAPTISPESRRVQVFNGRVLAPLLPTGIHEACLNLSAMIGCKMFEIFLTCEQGKYYFKWANCLPQLSLFPAGFVNDLIRLAIKSESPALRLQPKVKLS